MKIVEFAFIVYPATDMARSRAFYEGVLGLTSASSFTEGDQFWIEYEIGPHTLGIGNEPFLKPSGDSPHLVLEVDHFEETMEHLKREKGPFAVEHFIAPQGCIAATFWTRTATSSAFPNGRPPISDLRPLTLTCDF